MGKPKDTFDDISPIDYRYWDEETAKYLSEKAFVKYKILVEISLAKALYERGMYSESVFREIKAACGQVTVEEVYDEEKRIHHDVRALVNCIRANVSAEAKPYIHLTAYVEKAPPEASNLSGSYRRAAPISPSSHPTCHKSASSAGLNRRRYGNLSSAMRTKRQFLVANSITNLSISGFNPAAPACIIASVCLISRPRCTFSSRVGTSGKDCPSIRVSAANS